MKKCLVSLEEDRALAYLDGTLPEAEAEEFEAHYFQCPECLARVQTLEAMEVVLGRLPAAEPAALRRRVVLGWPALVWALGAAAGVLVLSVIGFREYSTRSERTPEARSVLAGAGVPGAAGAGAGNESGGASAPVAIPAPEAMAAAQQAGKLAGNLAGNLADLAMPGFTAPNLRGESEDARFLSGMKAYERGDCRTAVASLAKVPATVEERPAARFYSGACQMRLGNFAQADANLHAVADMGDSPLQEAALYTLAQTALLKGDPQAAHGYLLRTVSLAGDLEGRARRQDLRVRRLIESAGKPGNAGGKP